MPGLPSVAPPGMPAPAKFPGANALLLAPCREGGVTDVELTPPIAMSVSDVGELVARVKCLPAQEEHLRYTVKIGNIVDDGKPQKADYYLKQEIYASSAPQQIAIDLRNTDHGSVRTGFVQLLRGDEVTALEREAAQHDGVLASLASGIAVVSGTVRIRRL